MRWLIVEDALRDRKGHWLEYVATISDGLRALGDEVTVLADRKAEPFVVERLRAKPILPKSIWHRMGQEKSRFVRYGRVPIHALATWWAMSRYLRKNSPGDIIFVPTVTVHHLLGWTLLLGRLLRTTEAKVLLFFINLPVRHDPGSGRPAWISSPTAKLMNRLLQRMAPAIRSGRVVLGAEPPAMQSALAELTGQKVIYLPQPVPDCESAVCGAQNPCMDTFASDQKSKIHNLKSKIENGLLMACYGAARGEKGSDILQEAIGRYLQEFPDSRARFALQWIEDFENERGQRVQKDAALVSDSRVEYVTNYFKNGEYPEQLKHTDVLLLPYRLSSYRLRGSRVALEGMTMGIPLVVTGGSSFAGQMENFGAGLCSEDGDVASLTAAIRQMELQFEALKAKAMARKSAAQEEFSVSRFRQVLLAHLEGSCRGGREESLCNVGSN
ncbi:MAG: hypothetical protein C5B50_28240 [Verrucomicrobia bacterium]|nr:MAG: hypothetical protein C5B50_28240 [Verrucomicrobiota bacterium]